MNMLSVAGRTALVTGASSGLGRFFAKTLAENGARVAIAARRVERLEMLAAEIAEAGGEALPVAMDVTDPASVDEGFDALEAHFGAPADILINNAGLSRDAWSIDMSEEDWSTVVDTNLTSVWRVAKATASRLKEAGKPGAIVNISSITALRPALMLSAYAASKAGVDHLTRVMAVEMARYGVRVNAIAPGYFKTEINDDFLDGEQGQQMMKRVPMRRMGEYHELAGPLLLLVSDAGSYMTGETIVVDGGHSRMSL